MHEALYHPGLGYYTTHIDSVGPRGDFSTTATLSPLLAQALAASITAEVARSRRERTHRIGAPASTLSLVEIGPGDGSLARHLLDALPWRLRRKTKLHLVEISPRLQTLQKQTLKKYQKQITWHTTIQTAIDEVARPCQGRTPASSVTLVYSNELVDAFPASVYQFNPDTKSWSKLHLTFHPDKGIKEILLPSSPPTGNWELETFNSTQRIEVHESYHTWVKDWLPVAPPSTLLLTIDYGDTTGQLYHRRPRGTLRAYHRHQRYEGPEIYARFGKQDLTADVNFTQLIDWGTPLGLETLSLQSQRDFILTHLPSLRDNPGDASHFLIDPHGPGTAFKILHQQI
jgi:SAM-dependent MidA family methyltransferase